MKRILIVLLILTATVISVAGCVGNDSPIESDTLAQTNEETSAESETKQEASKNPTITAECVVKKGNRYVIVLPVSNKSIPVDNSYVKYLPMVTDELVRAAEAKITAEAEALGEDPQWTIASHEDKKLCLVVEVIKFVEGADYMEEVGCGIDHEHIFFAESIIEDAE